MRREEVPDSRWALDRDFLTAMAVTERLFLLARQGDVRERNPALKPRVALRKVAHHLVQPVAWALWVEWVQLAASLQTPEVVPQALADESQSVAALRESSLQAQSSPVQQALRMAAPLQLAEPESSVQLPLAPPVQLALPLV